MVAAAVVVVRVMVVVVWASISLSTVISLLQRLRSPPGRGFLWEIQ